MTNWQRERLDKAVQDFADEMKCMSCIHRDICFAQKGGVNLMLANTNCEYYKKADDFEEVVRCKDCGYYRIKGCYCMGVPTEPAVYRHPDDFCSHGIRRENEKSDT